MTADEFNADCYRHTYRNSSPVWDFKVSDGSFKAEFSVYDADVQQVFRDNIAYFSSSIEEELIMYATDRLERGDINEVTFNMFKELLKKVMP